MAWWQKILAWLSWWFVAIIMLAEAGYDLLNGFFGILFVISYGCVAYVLYMAYVYITDRR